jgi:hypothetical protein
MTTTELVELKEHIKELLEKEFIYLSSSPWGAPMIFVQRRIVHRGCAWIIVP